MTTTTKDAARGGHPPPDLFARGGEMGALMHATDWSKTRLGPYESWPLSLRTMLGVVLTSRFPMLLWWGPDLLHLYNDAYRPILRDKHPLSLGAPASEVWAEVWDVAGPMAQSVLDGGPATWTQDLRLLINNGGMLEETYFTFSYSPVPRDDGQVGGVLNTVQETTDKVHAERQSAVLRDLSAIAAVADTEADARRRVLEVLSRSDLDLSFALLFSCAGPRPTDVALLGRTEVLPASKTAADLPHRMGASDAWPFEEAARSREATIVNDLHDRFDLDGTDSAPSPPHAFVVALFPTGGELPYGYLVLGTSPHRCIDERYLRFITTTAEQVSANLVRARAYEAEKRRVLELAELDLAKTTFFSNVSHEFRTPLTLLLGPLDDALDSGRGTLSVETVESLRRNARRLLKLVNTLLDFSRLEAGRVNANFQPTDLAALTADLASTFRAAVEKGGVRFSVETSSRASVSVDREMWEKIVLNLLSNAFKFTIEGEISVRLYDDVDQVVLEVRDTGGGISEAELPNLFKRFHRVAGAPSRSYEGSGIGLALARELVELHRGTIRCASEVGRGSTFTVSLPAGDAHGRASDLATREAPPRGSATQASATSRAGWYAEEAAMWSEEASPQRASPQREETKPREESGESVSSRRVPTGRVLVVDDNADLRAYLQRLLAPHFEVDVAPDGQAGLLAARAKRPALILSDVMMPRLDGFGLVREIRRDPELGGIPIILLSARAGEESTVSGLESGADDYLAKPFSGRELLARVRTHIELAHQRQIVERFFSLSVDMMCIAGTNGYFKRVSPAFDALGYARDDLVSRPYIDFVHPDDRDKTNEAVGRLSENAPMVQFENRYRRKDGTYRWLSWNAVSEGATTLYAIARDVTEMKETQAALLKAKEAADFANKELESFSYSVAHDLRTPLRGIDGFSQALIEDFGDLLPDTGKRYLSTVREAAQQMAHLIDDLLALSRVTRSEFDAMDVDLGIIAQSCLAKYERLAPTRRVDISIAQGLLDKGDARLLAILFDNLLGNAWKFTSKVAEGRIEVGQERIGGRPVYFVRDNGAGFDMAFASKLFGVFQRLHHASEFEGTGIGLATVQRIVARHGGRIWAEAAVGKGATFRFTLNERSSSL